MAKNQSERILARLRVCQSCSQPSRLVAGKRTCEPCVVHQAERAGVRQRGVLTHREIAKLLGMSKSAVQLHEKRALAKLREGLEKLEL